MNDQQVAYQSQQVLLQEVDSQLETLSLRYNKSIDTVQLVMTNDL